MPSEPEEGVVFGRLFTFSPPTRASQLRPIDDRPVSVASPLNNITLGQKTLIYSDSFFFLEISRIASGDSKEFRVSCNGSCGSVAFSVSGHSSGDPDPYAG